MRKFLFLVFFVFLICFLVQVSSGKEDHYCHNDTITLEMAIQDSTFWAGANPDSLKLYWGTYSGTGAPVVEDSLILGSGNWTNWRIVAGDADAGYFVYKINASIDGTDSAYSCWAAAYALKGGVDGNKTWTWFVGACKEDSVLDELAVVQADLDTMRTEDSLTLFPFEKPGVLFESFDDTNDWNHSGNENYYWVQHTKGFGVREGLGAIELIATDDDSSYMYRTCGGSASLGTYKFRDLETISFWVCLNRLSFDNSSGGDWDLDLDGLDIILTNDAGTPDTWDSYYSITLDDTVLVAGWQHIILHFSQFTSTGGIAGSDTLGGIYFGVKTDAAADSLGVIFDDFRFNEKNRPTILVFFDDCHESIHDIAYLYLHDSISPPVPANLMLLVNDIDGVNSLTYSDVRTIWGGGWDVCNHCVTGDILTTFTSTNARDYVLRASRIIEDTLTPGPLHLESNAQEFFGAYPSGRYDQDIITMLREEGFLMWRTIITGRTCQGHLNYPGGDEWFRLKSHYLHTDDDTTTDINAYVDTCIMRGGLLMIMWHSLRDDGTEVGHQFDTVTFKPVMRYMAAKRDSGYCDILTLSEYFDRLRTSRRYELLNNKIISDLANYMGGSYGCYQRLFPEDGTPSKDSLHVICPMFGADSIVTRHYFQEYDSTYYDRKLGIFPSMESKKEFIK